MTDSNSIKSSYILIIRTCTYLNLWKGYGFIMSIILLRTVQIIRSHRGKNCKCAAKNEAKVSPESVRWYSASQRESIKSKHLKKKEHQLIKTGFSCVKSRKYLFIMLLKVKQSQRQFFLASILPKSEQFIYVF